MYKKKIIVYGLGKEYEKQMWFLKEEFNVVGYSDGKKAAVENYILPDELRNCDWDYIYITSSKYINEIKEELINRYLIEENKIISKENVLGDFRNWEIKREWVINKLQGIPAGKILLDAGAGELQYAPYCEHLKYIAQDFGKYTPDIEEGGLHLWDKWDTSRVNVTCDIIDMPFEDKTIDVILCSEVFEHLKNPVLAIKEFSRILKPGGKLILTAPFCSLTHMAPYYFCNGFSEYWYKENLGDYGFAIEEIIQNGNFFKYLCQELYRVNDMAVKYCHEALQPDEKDAIIKSIKTLSRLSMKDSGSSETLCFGYMIKAIKR